MNREVRKKTKAAKEEWIEEQCKNIQKETARRPSTPSRLSPRPTSISQQLWKTAVETS